ncbi:MAG: ATP-binding cassette domain-containing protein [Pseudomonadales bacterium]|nr:ATP-binding cassette domain-containing protein [Pseudomonadales bacterium]
MLTLTNLALRRGTELLFQDVSFTIGKGTKTGLVGANGSGKTSLFKLIAGELDGEAGEVDYPSGTRLAYMQQETISSAISGVEYVLAGDQAFFSASAALAEAEQEERFEHLAELHEQMAAIDGYSARARAEQLMIGLGFNQDELLQPVNAFSGGWQIRLNLARTLMQPSDLMLLDEPTNHLDLDAILWLSNWIKKYQGTLLLISHDRAFLDECVNQIAYLNHKIIEFFRGNYSRFEELKAARLSEQQSNYQRQQREVAHMQDFVRRFRAKATKARQAQSRLKALARMELIAPAHIDSPFHFTIPTAGKISNPLLSLDKASLGYQEAVLNKVRLSLQPGDRYGLLGHNGAGKSTLMRSLAGSLEILQGERTHGINLKIGYYSQQQVENLRLDESAFTHIQALNKSVSAQQVRDYLGGFDFQGDQVSQSVSTLSGGEKARLALSIIAYQKPNLLLLDEPTNHLDMDMCQALTVALQEFSGAIVLISHDRHLLANTVNEFLLIEDGRVQRFEGDLSDYKTRIFSKCTGAETNTGEIPQDSPPEKAKVPGHKTARQLRTRIRAIEQQMDRLQRKIQEVETALSDPDIYTREQGSSLQQLLKDQIELKTQINDRETEWLEITQTLEA